MGKPVGLGPRLVAIATVGISKEEAGKQLQAQAAAGVPPEQMVFVNPQTKVVVPANMEQGSTAATVQNMASEPTAVQVAMTSAQSRRYNILGIDITNLVVGWNSFWKTLGLGQTYKTNQFDSLGKGKHPGRGAYESGVHSQRPDGTIGDLERRG